MREILFRGKDKGGLWIKGYYRQKNVVGGTAHLIYRHGVPADCYYDDAYKVNPDTVGQYTGLTDKNGVKIFEGDIIRFYNKDGRIYWRQSECRFYVHWECGGDMEFDDFDAGHSAVIGNIYGYGGKSKQA